MKRWLIRLGLLASSLVVLFTILGVVVAGGWQPVPQEALSTRRVYAYRDWQSLGLRVHPGEMLEIKAQGRWLYTPEEYHGPGGHARYRAPAFYPLPRVSGGCLIGRIGEEGDIFYVGRTTDILVQDFGTLYLRINDDILSDNDGWVSVEVTVMQPEED